MATLTIRNLEEDVVEALKVRARLHNRSLEAELRVMLRAAAVPMTREQFRARALEIAAMTPEGPQTDSVELLRTDRGR
jgi:antitoxin FitA